LPSPRPRLRRYASGTFGALLMAALISLLIPGCRAGYVIRSAWYEAGFLASRESFERARARPDLSPQVRHGLDLVEDIKRYGQEIGMKPTRAYNKVSLDWDRKMFNLSACPPLRFDPVTWWFPIVGRVPYLGFFDPDDAERWHSRLEGQGYDVYQRKIGTFSSLGWFSDPLLPGMLDGSDFDVARLVLHELAHSTVWVPGSVSFNESFASYVGDKAALGYILARKGPLTDELQVALDDEADTDLWHQLLHDLYGRLDAVYQDPNLSEEEKLARKSALFAGLPDEVRAAPFHDRSWALKASQHGPWNNARLIQFRTYNQSRPSFDALLERHNGDLLAFMTDVQEVTSKGGSPWKAIREAAGVADSGDDGDQSPTSSSP